MDTNVKDTPSAEIKRLFAKQTNFAPTLKSTTVGDRLKKLDHIYKYILDANNQSKLKAVLAADLGKPEVEAMTSEISILLNSIKDIKHKLRSWMADKKVSSPLVFLGTTSKVHYEPKGVALIISPWNYPFQLCINPLLYAIAAGCTAILKPSEYSQHTSAYIADMIASLFSEEEVAVCQGGIPTSETLLSLPFNHMYFTGSPTVGKIVMKSASDHLSSVTLELGGKSPCFVDQTVNIDAAAKKIVWGKFFNCGQTCIAPDYILVPTSKEKEFLTALKKHLQAHYDADGKGIKNSPDLGRIINEKHFDKLVSLLADAISKGANIETGGKYEKGTKYMEPTILTGVDMEADIMKEEIFGPLMPIITYDDVQQAINIVNDKPKPLALYIMSGSKKYTEHVINNTSAGGTVVNDLLIHFANHNLPFGGVNNSGIGKSHGKHGFMAFSNERAVMNSKISASNLLHPPYTDFKRKIASLMGKWI